MASLPTQVCDWNYKVLPFMPMAHCPDTARLARVRAFQGMPSHAGVTRCARYGTDNSPEQVTINAIA